MTDQLLTMDLDLRKPYNPKPRFGGWISAQPIKWHRRRRNARQQRLVAAAKPPSPPPPSVQHRGWRKHNKNRPADRTIISIVDGGWNGPVQLLDPARGAPAPPRNSETRPLSGWGGGRSEKPVPVYVRYGPFRFDLLRTEIQLRVVECVLMRGGEAAWNIWATAGWVRDLCSRVQRGWS